MLRYFYIILCIQVCFCSVYVDNNEYEVLDRRIRCKTTKLHKRPTRRPRKSQVVQFDVQKFMRTPDSQAVEDTSSHILRSKKRLNRLTSANEADFIETHETAKGKFSNPAYNTRSSLEKYQSPRHFNFHSLVFDDKNDVKVSHEHKKAKSSFKQNKLMNNSGIANNPERKCSFRNMKIPFFSHNKSTIKSKRHKKRRIFCFNCIKKTTPMATLAGQTDKGQTDETPVLNTDDFNKDNTNILSPDDKTNRLKIRKMRKRAYEQLCPKCIRELLMNLKNKTTKKVTHTVTTSTTHPTTRSKSTTKKRTMKQRADLSDSLREGYIYMGSERLKRNEDEEEERERRLKELEEVEKKIENVHVVAPTKVA